jgi:Ras-related C3 botulinum toxin substrate 1
MCENCENQNKVTTSNTIHNKMDVNLKLVAVGDGAVGKTCLLWSYAFNSFPEDYIPTVFDNYNANVMYGNQTVTIGMWDTAGQDDYDRLRPLSYPDANVFIICYSVVNSASFENVRTKWAPEIRHYCPDVPIVLAGTKADLREDPDVLRRLNDKNQSVITQEEGIKMQQQIGACAFVEVSARTQHNLKNLFNECIKSVVEPEQEKTNDTRRKIKCTIC